MTHVIPLMINKNTKSSQNTSRQADGTKSGNHLPAVAPSGVFPLFAKAQSWGDLHYFQLIVHSFWLCLDKLSKYVVQHSHLFGQRSPGISDEDVLVFLCLCCGCLSLPIQETCQCSFGQLMDEFRAANISRIHYRLIWQKTSLKCLTRVPKMAFLKMHSILSSRQRKTGNLWEVSNFSHEKLLQSMNSLIHFLPND